MITDHGRHSSQAGPRIRQALSESCLAGLSAEDQVRVADAATLHSFEAGQHVTGRGSTGQVGIVASGRIQTYGVNVDGLVVGSSIVGSGKLIGMGALFGADDLEASALIRSDVAWVDAHRLRHILGREAGVSWALTRELYSSLQVVRQLQQRTRGDLQQRIAEHLLSLADLGSSPLEISISHERLAYLLGSRREVVTRILGRFAAAGMLGLARNRIRVLDLERLRDVAASDR